MNNLNNLTSTTTNHNCPIQESDRNQNPPQQELLNTATAPVFKTIAGSQKRKAPDSKGQGLESSSKKRKISLEAGQISGEKKAIIALLDEWVKTGRPKEQRSKAREIIINLLFSPSVSPFITKNNLDLSELDLSELPDIFGYQTVIQKIKTLSLHENQLITLPESIGNLTHLTTLLLSFNQLTTLPESFTNLTNLTELYLCSNKLITLPENIGNLAKLIRVNLSSNRLKELPKSFDNLTKLTMLFLDDNKFKTLPENIDNLVRLTTLSAYDNPTKTSLESIENLSNKKICYL